MTPDLFARLRDRQAEARDQIPRLRLLSPVTDGPAFVGYVVGNPSVPSGSGQFVAVHPVTVLGEEGEANSGSLSVNTSVTVLVAVFGAQPPALGDCLLCRFVAHRWVAEKMGHPPNKVVIPGCPCAELPTTIHMTVNDPSLNFGMFQNATIVYGPTPASLQPVLPGAHCYLSTDDYSQQGSTERFRYWFTCYSGLYILSRVYEQSSMGSPFRDAFRYSWLVGLRGNSCTPFLLSHGTIYPGGDPACVVTLSE